jgi:glutathione peroxidase
VYAGGMMKKSIKGSLFVLGIVFLSFLPASSFSSVISESDSPLNFKMNSIEGEEVNLADYKEKVVLMVNVASKCGLTPQYEALQAVYEKYKDDGLVILGFPANNFGAQEPGTNSEIKEFCAIEYGVSFPMFSKISVKGEDQHPLYDLLTSEDTNPQFGGDIKWNFTKFLIDRDGKIVNRFEPRTKPDSPEVVSAIEEALGIDN